MPQSEAVLVGVVAVVQAALVAAILMGGGCLLWHGARWWRQRGRGLSRLDGWPEVWTSAADPAEVAAALTIAARGIERHTPYTPEAIMDATRGLTIHVRAVAEWEASPGGVVARGRVDIPARSITVAPDLEALCHELGHLVEREAVGRTDATHRTWLANGLFDAAALYHAWLASMHRAREREAA